MFTGIVEATAKVIDRSDQSLTVERPASFDDIKIGSSIAVSGVCLSVMEFDDTSMRFDVVPETFAKTRLGSLNKGDSVNLERAMKADGRFEGHIVQGHIEGVATVHSFQDGYLSLEVPEALQSSIVSKGSIAIDGISLTVASIDDSMVTIALIPHTLENTTLGRVQEGDSVNIETDILAKYVQQS